MIVAMIMVVVMIMVVIVMVIVMVIVIVGMFMVVMAMAANMIVVQMHRGYLLGNFLIVYPENRDLSNLTRHP